MLPDRVSNPGPLTYESGALPIALRGPVEGNALDRKHFIDGSTLFAFQLEPNFSHHGDYLTLVKNGNVRLEVQFKTRLTGIFFLC